MSALSTVSVGLFSRLLEPNGYPVLATPAHEKPDEAIGVAIHRAKSSEGAGARTLDLRIKSPLLYQLSYALNSRGQLSGSEKA